MINSLRAFAFAAVEYLYLREVSLATAIPLDRDQAIRIIRFSLLFVLLPFRLHVELTRRRRSRRGGKMKNNRFLIICIVGYNLFARLRCPC